MARGGAPPRARDQESADADSAVRRAHAAPLQQRRRRRRSALVEECTSTIVGEVDSLKALVDEFSQFARMPAPRAVPTDLHALLNEALALYHGLLGEVRFERRFADEAAEGARRRRADSPRDHQPRRQRDRGDEPLGRHHARDAARSERIARAADRHRRRAGHPRGRAREAVHAVLFDQAPRQRPRPRDRPAHRRRARRDDRGRRQRAARHASSPSSCHADLSVSTQRRGDAENVFRKIHSAPPRLCVETERP